MSFESDAGVLAWTDLPVTSASAQGVKQSYTAQLNGNSMLTVYGESDGVGGVQNLGVGIGSTTPWGYLSVNPNNIGSGRPLFAVGSSTATQLVVSTAGNVGIGTTDPRNIGLLIDKPQNSFVTTDSSANAWNYKAQLFIKSGTSGGNGLGLFVDNTANARTAYIQAGHADYALASAVSDSELALQPFGGNVGVGTSSPAQKLTVAGGGSNFIALDPAGGNDATIRLNRGNSSNYYGTQFSQTNAWTTTWQLGYFGGSPNAADLTVYDSGTPRVTFATGGNVGIGTTTPQVPLSVAGEIRTSGTSPLLSFYDMTVGGTSRNWAIYGSDIAEGDLNFKVSTAAGGNPTSGTSVMYFNGSGNVGIGTTSPSAKLAIAGQTYSNTLKQEGGFTSHRGQAVGLQLLGLQGGWNSGIGFGSTNANPAGGFVFDNATGDLTYYSTTSTSNFLSGDADLVIKASGNVGIGTTNPGNKLTVLDSATNSGFYVAPACDSTSKVCLGNGTGNRVIVLDKTGGNEVIQLWTNNNERMRIGSEGNVGIGTSSAYPYLLSVGGTSSANGGLIFTNSGTENTPSGIVVDQGSNARVGLIKIGGLEGMLTHTAAVPFRIGRTSATSVASTTSGNFTTELLISTTGNVGIGTTSPTAKFEVNGNTYVNGSVGIGTAAPISALHIATNAPIVRLEDTVTTIKSNIQSSGGILSLNADTGNGAAGSRAITLNLFGTEYARLNNSGNFGIGTSSPYARLSVAGPVVADSFNATNTAATSTFAGGLSVGNGALSYDWSSGVTSIDNLELGSFMFDTNAGMVSWADMPVTATAAAGVVQSYTAQLDGNPLLTVYAESDGAGGIRNPRVGVGSTTPWAQLSVNPNNAGGPAFAIGSSTKTDFVVTNGGSVGVGTTSPYARLSVVSNAANTASAAAAVVDTSVLWDNDGARLLSLRSNGVERLGVARSGTVRIGRSSGSWSTDDDVESLISVRDTSQGDAAVNGFAFLTSAASNWTGSNYGFFKSQGGWTGWTTTQETGNAGATTSAEIYTDPSDAYINLAVNGTTRTQFNPTVADGASAVANLLDTSTNLANASAKLLAVRNAGSEKLTVLANGNVGINATAPAAPLDVQANLTGGTGLIVRRNAGQYISVDESDGSSHRITAVSSTGAEKPLTINNSVTGTGATSNTYTAFLIDDVERMRVDYTGKVGIGTTTPVDALTIQTNDSHEQLLLSSTPGSGYSSRMRFISNAGYAYNNYIGADTLGSGNVGLIFQTGNGSTNTRMVIDVNGNVGIGSTTPWARLGIKGSDASANTRSFAVSNSSDTSLWEIRNDGKLLSQGNSGRLYFDLSGTAGTTTSSLITVNGQSNATTQTVLTLADAAGRSLIANFNSDGSGQRNLSFNDGTNGVFKIAAITGHPAGNMIDYVTVNPTINPSSGSGSGSALLVSPTINQTGGANGTVYGLRVNPTLTSAADFRAVQIDNNAQYAIYQSGASARNYFAGNVGIGTTSPAQSLHIDSGSASVLPIMRLSGGGQATANLGRASNFFAANAADLALLAPSGQKLFFGIGSSASAVIDSSGNFGIGTTSPSQLLSVAGNIYSTGFARIAGSNGLSIGNDTGFNRVQISTTGFTRLGVLNSSNAYLPISAQALSIGSNYGDSAPPSNGAIIEGNVGIGTTSPISRLQLGSNWTANPGGTNTVYLSNSGFANSNIAPEAIITTSSSNTTPGASIGLALHNTDTTAGGYSPLFVFSKRESGGTAYNSSIAAIGARTVTGSGSGTDWIDGDLMFYTAPTAGSGLLERMRIDQAGNIGIGTTTATSKLYVTGTSGLTLDAGGGSGAAQLRFISYNSNVATTDTLSTSFTGGLKHTTASGLTIGPSGVNPANNNSMLAVEGSAAIGANYAGATTFSPPTNGLLVEGNVGIGTTSPYQKLSVVGNVVAESFIATSTTATSTIAGFLDVNGTGSNATSTFASNLWVKGTLRTGTGSLYLNDTSITAGNSGFQLNTTGNSYVNNVSGNFGIGTNNPSTAKLQVVGNVQNSYSYTGGSSAMANSVDLSYIANSSGGGLGAGLGANVSLSGTGGPQVLGSVYGKLNLSGSPSVTYLGAGVFNTGMSSGSVGSTAGVLGMVEHYGGTATNASAGEFKFLSGTGVTNGYGVNIGTIGGTNKWSLYSSDASAPSYFAGNVGIGTTTPAAKLDVAGAMRGLQTGAFLGYWYDDTGASGTFNGRHIHTELITNPNWSSKSVQGQSDNITLRLVGYIKPAYTETYTFYSTSDDGQRLYVNGQQLINNWASQGSTEKSATIALTAGRWYPIVAEHYQGTGGESYKLEWQSTSQAREVLGNTPSTIAYSNIDPMQALRGPFPSDVVTAGNFVEKSVTLNATTTGWHRIISANPGGISQFSAGTIRYYALNQYDGQYVEGEFQFSGAGYGGASTIFATRGSTYTAGQTPVISQVRVSNNNGDSVYVDVYVSTVGSPQPIIFLGYGPKMPNFVTPVSGAVAGPGGLKTITMGAGAHITDLNFEGEAANGSTYGQMNFVNNYASSGQASAQIRAVALATAGSGYAPAGLTFYTGYNNGPTERMRIDDNGRIGIGTTSPQKVLHVFDSTQAVGNPTIRLEGRQGGYGAGIEAGSALTTSGAYLSMGKAVWDGENSWNSTASTQDSYFTVHTTLDGTLAEKFRITSSGNVGISQNSPASGANSVFLHVGDGTTSLNKDAYVRLQSGNGSGGARSWDMHVSGGGAYWEVKDTGGNAGIRANYASSIGIQFYGYGAGTLVTDASGNITASSDERLKDIQGGYARGLADIMNIEPILYKWNATSTFDSLNTYAGFSAQNVQASIPEAVATGTNGYLGLQDRPIIASLVNAVKNINQVMNVTEATTTAPSFKIDASGNIGIGTTTPDYRLHVIGDVAATSFVNISTREAKKDIEYLGKEDKASVLDRIKTIGVAQYHYNIEDSSAPLRLGLIAEEAPVEVLAVGGKGVDIYKLSTFILAGVQELGDKFDSFELTLGDLASTTMALASTTNALDQRLAAAEAALAQVLAERASTTASTSSSTIAITWSSDIGAQILSLIESAGLRFANGIAYIRELVAEKLTANVAYIKDAVIESATVDALTVGSADKRHGITLYDEYTGLPYCLKINNGMTLTSPGACSTVQGSSANGGTTENQTEIPTGAPEDPNATTTEQTLPGETATSTPPVATEGETATSTPSEPAPEAPIGTEPVTEPVQEEPSSEPSVSTETPSVASESTPQSEPVSEPVATP
ncbi:MAG: tail fiber domain-containing protein [Candidatus Taylorbacteria bacterium]|nr:tail fiber domain-containing protein [Candidatus Taylorbacteria bacterium]